MMRLWDCEKKNIAWQSDKHTTVINWFWVEVFVIFAYIYVITHWEINFKIHV